MARIMNMRQNDSKQGLKHVIDIIDLLLTQLNAF